MRELFLRCKPNNMHTRFGFRDSQSSYYSFMVGIAEWFSRNPVWPWCLYIQGGYFGVITSLECYIVNAFSERIQLER